MPLGRKKESWEGENTQTRNNVNETTGVASETVFYRY